MYIGEIPEIFKSEDTVYHYCDLNTAVEYILGEKRLRLSHRKKATDPIECLNPWFSYSSTFISDLEARQSTSVEANRIGNLTLEKIANAKQLCLCTNKSREQFKGIKNFPEEFYGFLKPRMWDQYGNKYKGVCLAFSLPALQKHATEFVHGRVEYFPYSTLKLNHYSIDEDRIALIGVDQYWAEYSKRTENIMFRKHTDYESENEYKFISFSANEVEYLSIKDCLTGIIVSANYTSDFMRTALNKYAEEFKVELLYLKWEATGIKFTTQKQLDDTISEIKKLINSFEIDTTNPKEIT